MDGVLLSILAHGFCLILLGLFFKIVHAQGAEFAPGRYIPLAGAVALWILCDGIAFVNESFAPGIPLSSLALRITGFVLLAGGILFFYVQLPRTSPRALLQKRSFAEIGMVSLLLVALSLGALLGPAWLARMVEPWRPFLSLPAAAGGLIILSGPLMNTRTLLHRILLYVGMIASAAFLGTLSLRWIHGAPSGMLAPFQPYDPYLLFVFITGMVLALGVWHTRYLKLAVQFVFFRDVYRKEKELGAFLNELQAVTNSRESRESLLETILQNLYRVYHFEKALILTTDDAGKKLFRQLGTPSARLGIEPIKKQFPFIRLRLPEKTADHLDQVFLLEPDFPGPLSDSAPADARDRHPRTAKLLRESVERFRRDGYQVFLPLIFHNVIQGVVMLGAKENGLPYFNGEVALLRRAHTLFAMALRNDGLLREFQARGREERNPLKNIRPPEGALPQLTRLRLQEKTLVYTGSPLREVVEETNRIASLPLPVLIQGETGTGKELFARLLHVRGPGEERPFVAVNCAAIPASLWESEIFGYRRGAFTGASRDHPGFIEQAAGGLLFFDEIGEMPLEVQPKILRLIQEKTYQAVGARKPSQADCRLVFATHRDLAQFSAEGKFREDLYYRINVHRIQLPALRQRRAEIPLLADYLQESGARELNLGPRPFSAEALECLSAYDWPGNIRELENCILGCIAQASGDTIQAADLPREIQAAPGKEREKSSGKNRGAVSKKQATQTEKNGKTQGRQVLFPEKTTSIDFETLMKDYARELIEYTLKTCRGNRTHAAQMLGISRGKLIYQIKELEIEVAE